MRIAHLVVALVLAVLLGYQLHGGSAFWAAVDAILMTLNALWALEAE